MGLVLAAFSWAYAAGQVPVGWLGDRLPEKGTDRDHVRRGPGADH